MARQTKHFNKIHFSIFTLSVMILMSEPGLFAQSVALNKRYVSEESVKEVTIPYNRSYAKLYIDIKGGDGGNASVNKCRKYGGTGATLKAVFKIGKDGIPAGSTLRFVRGYNGGSSKKTLPNSATAAGGGGGGSAVLYRKPSDTRDDDWEILAVAGGGGGAYSRIVAFSCEGYHGEGSVDAMLGLSGKDTWGRTYGRAGKDYKTKLGLKHSGGGSGAFEGASLFNSKQGYPKGEKGGNCDECKKGGFGFGGGGASRRGAGGGGGYIGGDAGYEASARGGGSFFHSLASAYIKIRGIKGEGKNEHGHIKYEFANADYLFAEVSAKAIRVTADTKKCMEVDGQSAGANIRLRDCDEGVNQRWYFAKTEITHASGSDKCLDLAFNKSNNGTNIQLWSCNHSDAQQWVYDGVSQQIRNRKKWNKCLDYENAGGNIRIWDCLETPRQKWKIDGPHPMADEGSGKVKTIYLAKDPGKCMDLFAGKTANNRTNVQLWDCHGQNPQKWLFDGINIRYYALQKKCLDLDRSNTRNGTNIHLWDCNNTGAQRWVYEGTTGMIRYRDNLSKCLVAKGGSTTRGTNIEIRDCNDSKDQQWGIRDADVPFGPDKVNTIHLAVDQNRCLVVAEKSATVHSGVNIQQWVCNAFDKVHQEWIYDGLYLRSMADSTKCLDLKNGDTKNETNIQLWTCNGNKTQRWFYDEEAQVIRYADNWNKCLDVKKGRTYEPANVRIFDCDAGVAQRWVMRDKKQ